MKTYTIKFENGSWVVRYGKSILATYKTNAEAQTFVSRFNSLACA